MSGARAQKTINADGVIYDAVTFKQGAISCLGCELPGMVCAQTACYPGERDDGLWAIWKRRITNTPVEGTLP
jgi:hypothetical protein